MTEFIKKIDLLNAMARIQPSSENYNNDIAYWAARDMFDDILFQINAVTDSETEYIPIVYGHWIINSDGYYPQCSNCMREPESGKMTKFCSNCGAKMDEVIK